MRKNESAATPTESGEFCLRTLFFATHTRNGTGIMQDTDRMPPAQISNIRSISLPAGMPAVRIPPSAIFAVVRSTKLVNDRKVSADVRRLPEHNRR